MKSLMVYLMFIALVISCKKEKVTEETNPHPHYQLTAILLDPGEGSGTFQPVNSNKVVTFQNNGKITSNGELCDLSISTGSPSTGTYSLVDSTITTSNCTLDFEISSNVLIIHYPCIEPCMARYEIK